MEDGKTKLSRNILRYYDIALKTYEIYLTGDHKGALECFYEYSKMKHKHKFTKAWELFTEERNRLIEAGYLNE